MTSCHWLLYFIYRFFRRSTLIWKHLATFSLYSGSSVSSSTSARMSFFDVKLLSNFLIPWKWYLGSYFGFDPSDCLLKARSYDLWTWVFFEMLSSSSCFSAFSFAISSAFLPLFLYWSIRSYFCYLWKDFICCRSAFSGFNSRSIPSLIECWSHWCFI